MSKLLSNVQTFKPFKPGESGILVVGDALAPGVADGGGATGGEVDVDHYGACRAFYVATGIDDALVEYHRAVGDIGDCGEHFDFFIDFRGCEEVAVNVGYDRSCGFAAECVGHELAEVGVFAHVEKLEVDRVVEMAEHVDVVEAYLHRHPVAEIYLR